MNADSGTLGEEIVDQRALFMGREIVRDDVDLAFARLGGYDLDEKSTNSALVWRGAAAPAKDLPRFWLSRAA